MNTSYLRDSCKMHYLHLVGSWGKLDVGVVSMVSTTYVFFGMLGVSLVRIMVCRGWWVISFDVSGGLVINRKHPSWNVR